LNLRARNFRPHSSFDDLTSAGYAVHIEKPHPLILQGSIICGVFPNHESAMPVDESLDEEFKPDDFLIEATFDGQVRLVWERNSGERRAVVLDRNQLLAVLQELQKQTEYATLASTDLLEILYEDDSRVTRIEFAPQADQFRLTAFVDLPKHEKELAIALLLSEVDVERCVSAMTGWLEKQA
jgi:hypothetical protein